MEHQFTFVLLEDKAGNEFVWAMNGAVLLETVAAYWRRER